MGITNVLENKELSAEDKLLAVSTIVAKLRKSYGNVKVEIGMPEVSTCNGVVPFNFLSNDSKLAVVADRVAYIRRSAVEESLEVEGSVLAKIEEYRIATDDILANITAESPTTYL